MAPADRLQPMAAAADAGQLLDAPEQVQLVVPAAAGQARRVAAVHPLLVAADRLQLAAAALRALPAAAGKSGCPSQA